MQNHIDKVIEALTILKKYDDGAKVWMPVQVYPDSYESRLCPTCIAPGDVARLHALGWQWSDDHSEWRLVDDDRSF